MAHAFDGPTVDFPDISKLVGLDDDDDDDSTPTAKPHVQRRSSSGSGATTHNEAFDAAALVATLQRQQQQHHTGSAMAAGAGRGPALSSSATAGTGQLQGDAFANFRLSDLSRSDGGGGGDDQLGRVFGGSTSSGAGGGIARTTPHQPPSHHPAGSPLQHHDSAAPTSSRGGAASDRVPANVKALHALQQRPIGGRGGGPAPHAEAAAAATAPTATATSAVPATAAGDDVTGFGGSLPPDIGSLECTVYIQYLPVTMREVELMDLICQHGEPRRVRVCGNPKKEHNWTYGFVEYGSPEEAARFIANCDGVRAGPFRMRCNIAKTPIVDRLAIDAPPDGRCTFAQKFPHRTLRELILASIAVASTAESTPAGTATTANNNTSAAPHAGASDHPPHSHHHHQAGPELRGSGTPGGGGSPDHAFAGGHQPSGAHGAGGSSSGAPALPGALLTSGSAKGQHHTQPLNQQQQPHQQVNTGVTSALAIPADFEAPIMAALQEAVTFATQRNQSSFFAAKGSITVVLEHAKRRNDSLPPRRQTAALLNGTDVVFLCRLLLSALHVLHGSNEEALRYALSALQSLPTSVDMLSNYLHYYDSELESIGAPRGFTPLLLNHLVSFGLILEPVSILAARAFYHAAQHRAAVHGVPAQSRALETVLQADAVPVAFAAAHPLPPSSGAGGASSGQPSLLRAMFPLLATQEHKFAGYFASHMGKAGTLSTSCVGIFAAAPAAAGGAAAAGSGSSAGRPNDSGFGANTW